MSVYDLDNKLNAQMRKTPWLKEFPEAADAIRRYVKKQQVARALEKPIGRPRGRKKSTNRRRGQMRFNPKAKLDTSQIVDKRDKKKYDLTVSN